MRKGSGIAGATLLYGERQSQPDLVAAMQCLVDDLRGEGRRISGLRLSSGTMRLRADPYEIVLSLLDGPLPLDARLGLLRPSRTDGDPDFARVHLARTLRRHCAALGFLMRRRGAPVPDPDGALLTREAQLCLFAILQALPPAVIIWQPGGLVLTTLEFRSCDPALLLRPGDRSAPLAVPHPSRLGLTRPARITAPIQPLGSPDPTARDTLPQAPREAKPEVQANRERAMPRPVALPGVDRASDRIARAMRQRRGPSPTSQPRALARLALAAMLPWLGWISGSI